MDSDYAFGFIKSICRKNQFGEIVPSEYNYYVGAAQDAYYDWLIGRLEEYQLMKPVPRVAVGQSNKIALILTPLKVSNTPITVTSGIAPYPPDMDYFILLTDVNGTNIPVIADNKKPARLKSVIDPVSATNGFAVIGDVGWNVYPTTGLTPVYVSYYKRPTAPVWGYTVNGNGRAVYKPSASIDPVFNNTVMRAKILPRACKLLGISFTESDWVEYGEMVQKQGE